MNIAIPKVNDSIASCFEVAKHFKIFSTHNSKILSSKTIECHGIEDFQRVRLLRLYEIETLICNGINRFYRDQLTSLGINVIPNINGTINNALLRYLSGELVLPEAIINHDHSDQIVSHDELIKWTKELFEDFGYTVLRSADDNTSLIDLKADIKCPICKKDIIVAICCGAQIYKIDQEIMEFHHITKTSYQARVYVYLTDPNIAKSCDEYGITFISPEKDNKRWTDLNKSIIPIIQKPIEGHEKAFNY